MTEGYCGLDLYWSYEEVNKDFDLQLSNDANVEDIACIIGVRKWSWDGKSEQGPNLGSLGLVMREHVRVHDKYDLFIYIQE